MHELDEATAAKVREVLGAWEGMYAANVVKPVLTHAVLHHGLRFKPDHATAMAIAREAVARHAENKGDGIYATNIRLGNCDGHGMVQAAYIALTQGDDLLKPVEPPEVTAARKLVAEWDAKKGEG
jgi:hypothetical protein